MATSEGYAVRLARDVRRACGPPPSDVDGLGRWLDRELGVALGRADPAACVAGCRGMARRSRDPRCRGAILLPAGVDHPVYRILHELGHLLLGVDGYSLDAPRWHMLPAEVEADSFAACCLIDGEEFLEAMATFGNVWDLARLWDVPVSVVQRRMILAGREGIARARRFDRYLERPV